MSLADATVIVTGGGSGIGLALVEAVLAAGGRAVVWDLEPAKAAVLGAAVRAATVDVSDPRAVEATASRLTGEFAPTHLVNNAGVIGRRMRLAEIDADEIDRVLAINLKSVFLCTRAFLKARRPHASAAIVNLSSIAARTGGMPGNAVYAASKGAVASLTVAMAKELAPDIRVNALAPGVIDTPIQGDVFADRAMAAEVAGAIPLQRLGSAQETAAAALWLLSPQASYITATVVDVAGGR